MKPDYVFFDLDGVIIDSRKAITNSINFTLEQLNLKRKNRKDLYRFIGPPLDQVFRELLPKSMAHLVNKSVDLYRMHYAETCVEDTFLFDGVKETLRKLKNKKLILVTTKPEFFANKILKGLGVENSFEIIIGSSMSPKGSKKSVLIKTALRKIGSHSAIMVGDTKYDIIGAKKNRIPSVGVTYGIGTREELKRDGADYIIDDIRELPDLIQSKSNGKSKG